METIHDMKRAFAHSGRLEWIGMASARMEPLQSVEEAEIEVGFGLTGEHHANSGKSDRQVTIIQQEHLAVITACSGRDSIHPGELRRNLVVSGINLIAIKDLRFRIGNVLLEGTGPCDPCSRMEHNLGEGGYNAMRGHGGICARVLEGGTIHVGDEIAFSE